MMILRTAKTKLVWIVWLFCLLLLTSSSTPIHNEAEIKKTYVIEQSIGPLGTDSFEYHQRKLKSGGRGKVRSKTKKSSSSRGRRYYHYVGGRMNMWGNRRRMKNTMTMWMRGGNNYRSGSRGSHGKGGMGMYRKKGMKHCHSYYSHKGKGKGKGGGSKSYGVSTYKCTRPYPSVKMRMRMRMRMRRRMRKRMVMKMNTARQSPAPSIEPDTFDPVAMDDPDTSPPDTSPPGTSPPDTSPPGTSAPIGSTTESPTASVAPPTAAPTELGLVVIDPLLTRMTFTWFDGEYREPTDAEVADLVTATDAWFLEQLQQDFPPGGESVITDLVSDVISFQTDPGDSHSFNFSFNATFDPAQGSIPSGQDVFLAMASTDLTSYIVEALFPLTTNGQPSTFQNVQSVFWESLRRRLSQQVFLLPFLRHHRNEKLSPPRKLRNCG